MTLHDMLIDYGYRVVEDSWGADGRLTFIHDDEADRSHLAGLRSILARVGWTTDGNKLRSFVNAARDEEIEVEPGGSDVSGHFLHHIKTRVAVHS